MFEELLRQIQRRKVINLLEHRSKRYETEIARCKRELTLATDEEHKRKIQSQLDEYHARWIECTDIWTEILDIL